MKELNKKNKEEYKKSTTLRNLSLIDISYEQQQKVRKEQDSSYKKYLFFKELRKAVEKGK